MCIAVPHLSIYLSTYVSIYLPVIYLYIHCCCSFYTYINTYNIYIYIYLRLCIKCITSHISHIGLRQTAPLHLPCPLLMCRCLYSQSLLGGCSRGRQLLIYPWLKGLSLLGKVILFDWVQQLWKGHTWSHEGGRGHIPRQPDQPSQPWWSMGWQMP